MQSMSRTMRSAIVVALAAIAGAAGCGNPTPPVSSPSVQKGELGNGAFTFKCGDETAACDRWNNSEEFPKLIAQGSTFELTFYLRGGVGGNDFLKDATAGTTLSPASKKYADRGLSDFAALTPGVATITARDAKGWLVDYVTLQIVKPDALAIFDSDDRSSNPTRLGTIGLRAGQRKSYRVVAVANLETLAGSFKSDWSSSDTKVVAVEGFKRGLVSIVAKGEGTAKLTATGAGLEQKIDVEVSGTDVSIGDSGSADAGGDQ